MDEHQERDSVQAGLDAAARAVADIGGILLGAVREVAAAVGTLIDELASLGDAPASTEESEPTSAE